MDDLVSGDSTSGKVVTGDKKGECDPEHNKQQKLYSRNRRFDRFYYLKAQEVKKKKE